MGDFAAAAALNAHGTEAVIEGALHNPQLHNESCVAHRMHSALISANYSTHMLIGELAVMQMLPYLTMIIGISIACVGHKFLRPSLAILAFCVGSMASLHVSYRYANALHNWNCDAVVAVSAGVGIVLAMVSMMLVNAVSSILGFIAGGSFVILLFDVCTSCNRELWLQAPLLLNRPIVPFWVSFGIGAGVGWYACRRKKKKVIVAVTSIIGGWGTASSLRVAFGAQNIALPGWAHLLISFTVGGVGYGVQMVLIKRANAEKVETDSGKQSILSTLGQALGPKRAEQGKDMETIVISSRT